MIRLTIFLVFSAFIFTLLFYRENANLPVSQERFDISKLEKKQKQLEATLAQIEKEKLESSQASVEDEGEDEPAMPEFVADTPRLQSGQKIYQKKCLTCHGPYGQGKKSQKAPKIAGQHEYYLKLQILAIQSGVRVNKTMQVQIKNLSEQDIADVSAFVANYPWKF